VRRLSSDHFELQPEQGGSLFNIIRITFAEGIPDSIALLDNLGQTTLIRLTAVQLNPTLSDDNFIFEIPEGVDVINNVD